MGGNAAKGMGKLGFEDMTRSRQRGTLQFKGTTEHRYPPQGITAIFKQYEIESIERMARIHLEAVSKKKNAAR